MESSATRLKATHKDLAKWFEETYNQPIDWASITRILSPKYAFIDELAPHQLKDKRRRTEQWPELEKAVMDWIRLAEVEAPISQESTRYKAQQYWPHLYPNNPVPSFSNGIIQAWKALWKRQWVRYIVDEFDRGIDPLSIMTILRAVRWVVNIWEDQVTSTTITNCFKKALHDETEAELETAILIQDLQLTNRVQDVMDIRQFLNPLDEQVNDSIMDIDAIVLS
ncbi:hypothetical protein TSTA_001090 [Talaromyces stipitatus ATCC 10500]|uniref:DDE-1 domain-containing protein n=1 Tax=Talaromyces stipitatus (strain ATCC 10500 / CBS 375.48 / QM 6759 / NRRL 1006) TaxID=441959 RepID=B8MT13_TALSN|nr:uncharacterized protein TSTA_001090 [Talaromyces stipitatus ATCC 10500]EED12037.1 hypothetical protein TSTA_001090 [Talaromyces stipitatus ATCC 10500]